MSTQDHSGNDSRLLAVFTQGRFEQALTPDVIVYDKAQGVHLRGRDTAEGFLRAFFVEGFPAAEIEGSVEHVEDEHVVLALTLHGRQNGRFMGIPATGWEVQLSLTLVCRLRQGRIYHLELNYDAAALLRQLGLAL